MKDMPEMGMGTYLVLCQIQGIMLEYLTYYFHDFKISNGISRG